VPKYYTGKGDDGTTGWLGKGRLEKSSLLIEVLGALDEVSSTLGLARSFSKNEAIIDVLLRVQQDLYLIMTEVAAPVGTEEPFARIGQDQVKWLEVKIDSFSEIRTSPGEFILPGDSQVGAFLDIARTTVRRSERRLAELNNQGGLANPSLMRYINRLSSLCFVMELLENSSTGDTQIHLAKSKEK